MKSWKELEDRTLWDVTTNEGALTMLVLSMVCAILSIMYTVMAVYFKVKFYTRRIT